MQGSSVEVANFVDNVVDDKFFSVFERPLWNRKPPLRGVGATPLVGCNFGAGFDGEAKELGGEVGDGLEFIQF